MRSLARFARETKAASEAIRHDTIDDVQAEAGAARVAPRREKWMKSLAPDVRDHAAAIVGEKDLDAIGACGADRDIDEPASASGNACAIELRNRLVSTWPYDPG